MDQPHPIHSVTQPQRACMRTQPLRRGSLSELEACTGLLPLGLWECHKHTQDLPGKAGGPRGHKGAAALCQETHGQRRYAHLEAPPPDGSYCSASLPGKTKRLIAVLHILVADPQVQLVDAPIPLEVSPTPRLAVHDETTLGCVNDPIALVARGTHCGQGPTHLGDLIHHFASRP